MTTHMPHATADDYRAALNGLVFPVAKDAVLRHAEDHGGIDHEVLDIIAEMPDREYSEQHDLESAIRDVYLAQGVSPEAVPV